MRAVSIELGSEKPLDIFFSVHSEPIISYNSAAPPKNLTICTLGNRLTHLQNRVYHVIILELEYTEIMQMCNFSRVRSVKIRRNCTQDFNAYSMQTFTHVHSEIFRVFIPDFSMKLFTHLQFEGRGPLGKKLITPLKKSYLNLP